MISHGQVAAKVRAHKDAYPELYCAVPGCLWRVVTSVGPKSSNPCRKHPKAESGLTPLTPDRPAITAVQGMSPAQANDTSSDRK